MIFKSYFKVIMISLATIFHFWGITFLLAAEYPSKPVQVIIPWPAGGSTDVSTRTLINATKKFFPQPLVPINRPGGAGTIGMTEICMAKPDGYTIGSNAWGPMVTQPAIQKLSYSEKDYFLIMQTWQVPRVLVTHPSRPYKNAKEFIEHVKNNPGKIRVGLAGTGTTDHFALLEMEKKYGIKFTIVPMGGGAPQMLAVIGGHVDVATPIYSEASSAIQAGQVIPLAIMDLSRYPLNKEIPTLAELGYPIESGVANFLIAPSGVPKSILKFIHDAFKKGFEDAEYQEPIKKIGYVVEYLSPEESQKKIEKFRQLYIKLANEFGLTPK